MNSSSIDPGTATLVAAIIALVGAAIGFISSQLVEFLRISKEAKLRQKEKLLERMISAHESVVALADRLMTVTPLKNVHDLPDNVALPVRGSSFLTSKESFGVLWDLFISTYSHQVWLSTDTLKELNYVQDYMVNLNAIVESVDDKELLRMSVIIRQDFIDLSGSLRKYAMDFLFSGALNMKIDSINYRKWHKYPRTITEKRLNNTLLMKNYSHPIIPESVS